MAARKTPGMLVGATRSTWLLDISDQSVLMVAPPGAGKSTSVYIPTITYNARVNHNTKNGKGVGNGASMVLVSVKDDLYTITGPELRRCGYRVLKLDLRNVFSSCHLICCIASTLRLMPGTRNRTPGGRPCITPPQNGMPRPLPVPL